MPTAVIIEIKPQYESGKDIYLSLYLLIYNNFSSMTFFCVTRILRVIGRQSIVYNTCKRSLCLPHLIEINNK